MPKNVPVLISFLRDSALLAGGWTLDRLVEESTYENLAEVVCVVIPLLTASTYCVYKVTYCIARGLFISTKWVLQKTFAADRAADVTIEASSASTLSMPGQFTTPAGPNDRDNYASWASASQKICWGVRKGCLVAHKVVVATLFTVKNIVRTCGA
ncbi:hypothetical protein BU16DRAFT_522908 [Lophium mytilinum]|uniref:Uncharacterized protein n=1 Tax=Lophium mytilinum TaxID=390894 RepID=A0A6A6R674_9PEZI|nr:hypothetical protein BU16DRAFT_522908 [Lophium mytilinum]